MQEHHKRVARDMLWDCIGDVRDVQRLYRSECVLPFLCTVYTDGIAQRIFTRLTIYLVLFTHY